MFELWSGSQTERARSLRRAAGEKIAEILSRETQSRFQRLRHYYDLIYDVHDQISHGKLVIREAPL